VEFLIGTGVRLPERHDHAKPEGRPRAAGHDLVVPDRKWHGGDVMMPADLYPVHDGTDVTATVTHLNAVGRALDGEMVPRHVEGRGIRELEVVDFDRLGFPSDGEAPNAKWQIGETEGPGVEGPALRGLHCAWRLDGEAVPEGVLATLRQQVH
jgi:hypothetical protein